MSRTYRQPSTNRNMLKMFKGLKKVKDGTPTRIVSSCENNGGCPYCKKNRTYNSKKQITLKEELEIAEEVGYERSHISKILKKLKVIEDVFRHHNSLSP